MPTDTSLAELKGAACEAERLHPQTKPPTSTLMAATKGTQTITGREISLQFNVLFTTVIMRACEGLSKTLEAVCEFSLQRVFLTKHYSTATLFSKTKGPEHPVYKSRQVSDPGDSSRATCTSKDHWQE